MAGAASKIVERKESYRQYAEQLIRDGYAYYAFDTPEDLEKISGVKYVVSVVEENVLVKYRDKQVTATIKGVSDNYSMATGIDSMIVDGQMLLQRGDTDYAVVGGAIAYNLQMNMNDMFTQLEIYAPRRTATSFTIPACSELPIPTPPP